MVTEQEKAFVEWWKKNRDSNSGLAGLWLKGVRWALIFAGLTVCSFLFDWHKAAGMWARTHVGGGLAVVLLLAGVVTVVFMAVFYKRHKWEMYEQQYREILSKMPDNEGGAQENNGVQ